MNGRVYNKKILERETAKLEQRLKLTIGSRVVISSTGKLATIVAPGDSLLGMSYYYSRVLFEDTLYTTYVNIDTIRLATPLEQLASQGE